MFDVIWRVLSDWIYPALLVLFFFSLTIFVHELGHFWVARRRGMKVDRFSIGFGPKMFAWTRDGVEYRVSWLLFGGYVSLPQMAAGETLEGRGNTPTENLPPASPFTKILVALSGPIMNLVLAFLLAAVVWVVGKPMPTNTTVIGWVEPGGQEETSGIRPGDRLVEVNGQTVSNWTEFMGMLAANRQEKVSLMLERDGERHSHELMAEIHPELGIKTLNLYPKSRPYAYRVLPGGAAESGGLVTGDRILSVAGVPIYSSYQLIQVVGGLAGKAAEVKVMRRSEVKALTVTPLYDEKAKAGRIGVMLADEVVRPGPTPMQQFKEVFQLMGYTVSAIFHSKETGVGIKNLSGPVGIVGGWWAAIAYGGVRSGLWIAVLLNINLAILNLLPIPVLDGGHIIFSFIEALRRKPLNARFIQITSTAFAVLLIAFMLYVTFFDVQRFLPRSSKPTQEAPSSQTAPAPAPSQP